VASVVVRIFRTNKCDCREDDSACGGVGRAPWEARRLNRRKSKRADARAKEPV
jgi:hypothetical protein